MSGPTLGSLTRRAPRAPVSTARPGALSAPRAALAAGLLLAGAACADNPAGPGAPEPLALVGATVVDGLGGAPVSGQTLVLEDGRISAMGPAASTTVPEGAVIVDAAGLWIMPGLVDTHVHMPGPDLQARFLSNLLGFGVTTARSTAAAPSGGTELRSRLDAGEVLGPRFVTAGRLIDAPGSVWGDFGSVVSSATQMRAEVAAQAAQGVDFVKLYAGLTPDLVRAGIEEAHARGLTVVGHLGRTGWGQAVAAGIDHVTHGCIWGMASSVVSRADSARFAGLYVPNTEGSFHPGLLGEWPDALDLGGARFQELADGMRNRGVSWDPNLVLCEATVFGDDREVLERLSGEYDVEPADFPHPYSAAWSAAARAAARAAFPTMLSVVRALHEHGVMLTLGSDTLNPWMTPGAAALRELELLVEAGLTPTEAIVVGTSNGARALGILSEVGTVEVGRAADLLVLGGDPTEDVSNVRDLRYVVAAGRLYEPAALRRP